MSSGPIAPSSPHLQDDNLLTDVRQSRLNHAEHELHKLDIDLALILAKRSRLMNQINQYRSSLTPCNTLPYELIGEIIKMNMPKLQPLPLKLGKDDPRLQITRICSHWRRAAFQVNELWNNVVLSDCYRTGCIKLVSAWFRECSSTSIHLKIMGPRPEVPLDTEFIFEELVRPHSYRLSSLNVVPLDVNHFSEVPFDVLTSLSIIYCSNKRNRGEPMVAPLLRHFSASSIEQHGEYTLVQSLPSIPWEQLALLDLEGLFGFDDVYEVLAQCKLLEECKLQTVAGHSPDSIRRPVDLPRLRSLTIRLASSSLFDNLYSLSISNLNTLSINLPPKEPEDIAKFAAWMDVLSKTLRHITITRGNPTYQSTESQITRVMSTLPFITHFTTIGCSLTLDALRMIGTGELLPHLEVLEFLAPLNDRIEDMADALVPVGLEREVASSLREVFIHTYQRYCSGRRLGDLRDMGVNVWAVYRYPHVVGTGPGGAVGTWTLV